jgi:hypothetical protein
MIWTTMFQRFLRKANSLARFCQPRRLCASSMDQTSHKLSHSLTLSLTITTSKSEDSCANPSPTEYELEYKTVDNSLTLSLTITTSKSEDSCANPSPTEYELQYKTVDK